MHANFVRHGFQRGCFFFFFFFWGGGGGGVGAMENFPKSRTENDGIGGGDIKKESVKNVMFSFSV